jgi:osmotically-inducible protein OsmY
MDFYSQPSVDRCSRQITEDAKDRLRNDSRINRRGVSCDCEEGLLRLRGELPTFYEKQVAQEVVKGVDGVTGIINDIEVTG